MNAVNMENSSRISEATSNSNEKRNKQETPDLSNTRLPNADNETVSSSVNSQIEITLPQIPEDKKKIETIEEQEDFTCQPSINIKTKNKEFIIIQEAEMIASKIDLNTLKYSDTKKNGHPSQVFITRSNLSYSKIEGLTALYNVNFSGSDISNLKFFPIANDKNQAIANQFINLIKNDNPQKYQSLNPQDGISWEMIYDAITSSNNDLGNSAIKLLKNINITFNNKTKFLSDATQNTALYEVLKNAGKKTGFNHLPLDIIEKKLESVCKYDKKAKDVISDKDKEPDLFWGINRPHIKNQYNAINQYINKNKHDQDYHALTLLKEKLNKDPDSVFHGMITKEIEGNGKKEEKKFFIIGDKEKNENGEPAKIFVFEIKEDDDGKSFFLRMPLKKRTLNNPCKLYPEEILAHFVWEYECELTSPKFDEIEGESITLSE